MSGCLEKNQKVILKCIENQTYSADRFGNIYSNFKRKRKLEPALCNGYFRVTLRLDGISNCVFSHVFIWLYFHPELYSNENHVNHIDGNKQNNSLKNLELLRFDQNAAHAASKNLYKTGSAHPKWGRQRIDSHAICAARSVGTSVRFLAKMFQTSPSTISRVARLGGVLNVRKSTNKRNKKTGRFI